MTRGARYLLDHFEEDAAALLMALLMVALGLQVFTRYVLGDPLAWTEEAARYMFVWLVFFRAGAALRTGEHVRIDMLVLMCPRPLRLLLALCNEALILFFLGNLLYWGTLAVERMWSVPTATLEISHGVIYAVIPLTAVLMGIRTCFRIGDEIRGKGAESTQPGGFLG